MAQPRKRQRPRQLSKSLFPLLGVGGGGGHVHNAGDMVMTICDDGDDFSAMYLKYYCARFC
jgi:hypothetical protein